MMDTKFQKLIVMLAAAAVLASAGAYIKSELGAYTVSVERNTDKTDKITVTVKGAVEREGTYKLPSGSRVCDAVYAAGGLAPGGEVKDADAVLADGSCVNAIKEGGAEQTAAAVVNINTASVQDLTMIPGVGEITAQRIVDYRSEHGKFLTPQDITRVKGIGEKTFNKMKDYIKTEEQSQ